MGRVELSEEEYIALLRDAGRLGVSRGKVETHKEIRAPAAKKRKASAYSKKYGRAFKKVAPKYKKKKRRLEGWRVQSRTESRSQDGKEDEVISWRKEFTQSDQVLQNYTILQPRVDIH